jgi:hypothetical protein
MYTTDTGRIVNVILLLENERNENKKKLIIKQLNVFLTKTARTKPSNL